MKNLYLNLHVLQTVPSSNINRDDTGAPKTAIYGGATRARVSSQAWKRVMRNTFKSDNLTPVGIRTKKVPQLLATALKTQNPALSAEQASEMAAKIFKKIKISLSDNSTTKTLLTVSQSQIDKLAKYILQYDDLDDAQVTDIKKILKGTPSLDLVLFGRMVAEDPELNFEGVAQVAHAISTHSITPEFDYFTAVDDLHPEDNAGAAMIGTIEYNSATLYRYANLNVLALAKDLGADATSAGIQEYIKSFVLSMPTGKQNTFANKTLPSYVMVTLRSDTPVNLVSAFEQPVTANQGYITPSIKRLEQEFTNAEHFVDAPLATYVLSTQDDAAATVGEPVSSLSTLLTDVTTAVSKVMQDENTHD